MRISTFQITLKKRYPLRISRGLITENQNLWVVVEDGGLRGYGEMAPGGGIVAVTPERGAAELAGFASCLTIPSTNGDLPSIIELSDEGSRQLSPSVCAALDIALWDLQAKRAGMPLWRLLGLSRNLPPTSVTVGINPPEIQRERVPEILERTQATILKIKLGSPEGIDADKEAFLAILDALPRDRHWSIRVDANGGWSPANAQVMMRWLSAHKVEFVEQPLPVEQNDALPHLFQHRPLPLFVDESCQRSVDLPPLTGCIDGVVVKLMKAGGITEALRIVATARAHRLQTMIGCMGESSIGIAAGAAIASLCDKVDLDSHLNLLPDPARGISYQQGHIIPSTRFGHGGEPVEEWIYSGSK